VNLDLIQNAIIRSLIGHKQRYTELYHITDKDPQIREHYGDKHLPYQTYDAKLRSLIEIGMIQREPIEGRDKYLYGLTITQRLEKDPDEIERVLQAVEALLETGPVRAQYAQDVIFNLSELKRKLEIGNVFCYSQRISKVISRIDYIIKAIFNIIDEPNKSQVATNVYNAISEEYVKPPYYCGPYFNSYGESTM